MAVIGNVLGITAVVLYILSYQMKNRLAIILCNAASRVLYVAQYLELCWMWLRSLCHCCAACVTVSLLNRI